MKLGRLAAVLLIATAFVFYLGCLCVAIPHAGVVLTALFLAWRPTSRIALGIGALAAVLVSLVGVVGLTAVILGESTAWMLSVSLATLALGVAVVALTTRAIFWH